MMMLVMKTNLVSIAFIASTIVWQNKHEPNKLTL